MASSITSAAAFATANMKPVPDEQIDALWGQNVADNTGFLYYRKLFGPCCHLIGVANNLTHGTFVFEKAHGHTQFVGSLNGTVQANSYGSLTLWVNGTNVFQKVFDFTSSGVGTRFKASFGTALTGMTDGNFYEFSWALGANITGGDPFVDITTWQTP